MTSNERLMTSSKDKRFAAYSLLLLERDAAARSEHAELFRGYARQVYTAGSGGEGVKAYREKAPDLVAIAIGPEDPEGMETVAAIKKADPEIPLLVICSLEIPELLEEAVAAGVDGFLQKPLKSASLAATFERMSARMTQRRRYLHKRKLLQEYKKAVDAGAIVSKADRNGVITYVNDAFCAISGYSREELIGARHNIVRDPDISDAFFARLWETIMRKEIWRGTFKNRNKNGSAYYVSATIVPITDENDEIVEFLAIRQDVTELQEHRFYLQQRVKEEVERNLSERRAHEEERLREVKFSTIGRLAAGITHEINTPLTYMRGNLEMMISDIEGLADPALKSRLLEDARTVMEGTNRIASIVESMREMASHSKETMQKHNLYATLVTALTVAYNRSKQVCSITLEGAPFVIGIDKERCRFDICMQAQRIEQVWVIIINNALDVLKKVEPYEARRLTITIEEHKRDVTVRFRDNGGGIDETILPKIFEPFESMKQEGGIGVGLNIAKTIVLQHGGRIEGRNEGDGALFEVTLPKECAKK